MLCWGLGPGWTPPAFLSSNPTKSKYERDARSIALSMNRKAFLTNLKRGNEASKEAWHSSSSRAGFPWAEGDRLLKARHKQNLKEEVNSEKRFSMHISKRVGIEMLRRCKRWKTWREGLQSHHKDYILNIGQSGNVLNLGRCRI